jgi:16S rRNA G966 N2-methylase RsmD
MNNQYKFDKRFDDAGFSLYKEVGFNDGQKAHKAFWDKYERPPIEEYWDYIINRRDLLVPQDIRERKGSFFTPQQWVQKSQEYLSEVLGDNWQDEYYVWDCAAGTGNLLAGLTNKYNIWASTLDKADVDVMHDRIKNGANLLTDHVFQFDFLNDDFDKLPKGLQTIINSEAKRKKLVIYINPPYAESASSHKIKGKKTVEQSNIHDKYALLLKHAQKELFAQFIARIYFEIPGCKISEFSKLKILQSPRFLDFRNFFKANLEKCFVVHANTFDNVKGKFPIGFKIWDTEKKNIFSFIDADVLNDDGSFMQTYRFRSYNDEKLINDWCDTFKEPFSVKNSIATLVGVANDFQQQNIVFFDMPYKKVIASNHNIQVTENNLIQSCIYFTVRKCIAADWLNDREQFLFPNNKWEKDIEFQNDCLTYTLFNTNIQSKYGVNHWIPFSETEVNARDNFESHFMIMFIKGTVIANGYSDLFETFKHKRKALKFSDEAKTVFKAGKKLWQYYHSQPAANVNASLYDIREFFQGRDDNGKMNSTSGDTLYNALIGDLRSALKTLALKIRPKVYEYGFLLE